MAGKFEQKAASRGSRSAKDTKSGSASANPSAAGKADERLSQVAGQRQSMAIKKEDKPFPIIRKPVPVSKSGPLRPPKAGRPLDEPPILTNRVKPAQSNMDVDLNLDGTDNDGTDLDFLDLDEGHSWVEDSQAAIDREIFKRPQPAPKKKMGFSKKPLVFLALVAAAGVGYFVVPPWIEQQRLAATEQPGEADALETAQNSPTTDAEVVDEATLDNTIEIDGGGLSDPDVPQAVDLATVNTANDQTADSGQNPSAESNQVRQERPLNVRFREHLSTLESLVSQGALEQAEQLLSGMDRTLYGYGAPEFAAIEEQIKSMRAGEQPDETRQAQLAQTEQEERDRILAEQQELLKREAQRATQEQDPSADDDQSITGALAELSEPALNTDAQLATDQAPSEQNAETLAMQQEAEELAAQQEAERLAKEQAAEELAAQQETERLAKEQAAAEIAAAQEAERLAEEQAKRDLEAQRQARLAEEQAARELAARQASEQFAAQQAAARELAAQREARRLAEEQAAATALAAQREAQRLAEEQAAATALAAQRETERAAEQQLAVVTEPEIEPAKIEDSVPTGNQSAPAATRPELELPVSRQRLAREQELERVAAIAAQTRADRAIQERARREELSRAQAALQPDSANRTAASQPEPLVNPITSGQETVARTISEDELQDVYRRFDELQKAIRNRDITAVIELTSRSVVKIQQFQQMFQNNISIDARIKNVSTRDASGEIQGTLVITRLERADGVVTGPPLDLASVTLTSQRNEDGWSAIRW